VASLVPGALVVAVLVQVAVEHPGGLDVALNGRSQAPLGGVGVLQAPPPEAVPCLSVEGGHGHQVRLQHLDEAAAAERRLLEAAPVGSQRAKHVVLDRLPEAVAQLQEAPQTAQDTELGLVIELQVHRVLVVAGLDVFASASNTKVRVRREL